MSNSIITRAKRNLPPLDSSNDPQFGGDQSIPKFQQNQSSQFGMPQQNQTNQIPNYQASTTQNPGYQSNAFSQMIPKPNTIPNNTGYGTNQFIQTQTAIQHQEYQDVANKRDPSKSMNNFNDPNMNTGFNKTGATKIFNPDQALNKAIEKVDVDGINYKFFYLSVSGVVESGEVLSLN